MLQRHVITIAVSDTESNIHVCMTGRENPLGYYHWQDGEKEATLASERADANEWAKYYEVEVVEVGR